MKNLLQDAMTRHRRAMVMMAHGVVFAASLAMAFLLRFDFQLQPHHYDQIASTLPLFVLVKLSVFLAFRQYAGWWRYVSVDDLVQMIKATGVSMLVLAGAVFVSGLREYPRSIFVLDALVTLGVLSGLRVGIRLVRERLLGRGSGDAEGLLRTVVVGTGTTAESLVREASRSPALGMAVVGLVSDDPRHVGTRIANVQILGAVEDIPRIVRERQVEQVLIAVEAGSGDLVRRVVAQCSSADVRHRTLPPTEAIVQGRVSVQRIRDVNLQDLLGRPPARLENDVITELISGETALVTGAGGSIGSELCRQIARFGVGRLVMVEQAENPLFHLERELTKANPDVRLEPVIADVYDAERMQKVFAYYEPRVVLHAAAHKHVPLMEANPSEAIKNNIIGTLNVIRAAQNAGVERCVLISTDKAVNPTSVMGATKRVSEMLMQSLVHSSDTVLAAVRFGNVLGSNGSVIPIFKNQIAQGGPVTVTHPEMRRYFMTIPEATQLVLQAATYANKGDVFVLDMGDPVYIVDVARDLIRLSGLEPDEDVDIVFSGIRPGEKLFEELSTKDEETSPTQHERIFRCEVAPPDADVVLDAATRLEAMAHEGAPRAHLRRALFDVLGALEQRATTEALAEVAARVIKLEDEAARRS